MSKKNEGFKTSEKIALAGLAIFLVVVAIMGVMIVNNALDIVALLPAPKPDDTPVPGISTVNENAPPTEKAEQPFIADEIERITNGEMDVLHVETRGDFAVTLVIWVKEGATEAQGSEIDKLIASQYPIARLVNVQRVPQLDYMVFVVNFTFDCVATGIPEAPLQCAADRETLPGYVVPDEGLDLLNSP